MLSCRRSVRSLFCTTHNLYRHHARDIPEKNVQIPIRITSEQYCAITPEDAFTWKARIDAEVATSDGDDHVRRNRFPLRVLIVDDDPRIRGDFANQLDAQPSIAVSATASRSDQALDLLSTDERRTDAALIYSTATVRIIHQERPRIPVIMFTTLRDDDTLDKALDEEVSGFITKDETAEDVAAAIIRAVHGEPVLSARPTEILVNAYQSERRRQRTAQHMRHLVEQLPPRLQGVHARLLKGLTNHQIAEELDISENTVRIYVSDVLHHLGHSSRTELLAAAPI